MQSPRTPWWMYALGALFLADFIIFSYCILLGPEHFGISSRIEGGREVVTSVVPDSAAQRAGVKAGDAILAIDGQAIQRHSYWQLIDFYREAGRSYRFGIERGNWRIEVAIPIGRARWALGASTGINTIYLVCNLMELAAAFLIAFSRSNDPLARIGALTLAIFAVNNGPIGGLVAGYAPIWRHLPWLAGAFLWVPSVCAFFNGPMAATFCAIFPRKLFRARWPWVIIWLPALCLLPTNLYSVFLIVYRPGQALGTLPNWIYGGRLLLEMSYWSAALGLLAANYLTLTDLNEKRRVRVLVVGTAAMVLPEVLAILATKLAPESRFASLARSWVYALIWYLMQLLFVFCIAYAILRHRLFGIRVVIRQGLQYAMARKALVSAVPALGVVLVLDLALHSNQSLSQVLAVRGSIYVGLAGLALLAHAKRQQWLRALDYRFFREHYDAQRLLREVVEEVHRAGSLEKVASQVVAKIEAALHPQFAAVLVREPGGRAFRALASAPMGYAPPPLLAESKLVALLQVLGRPLEVPHRESGWLEQQLPHEDTDFLRLAHIDLLVPIAVVPDRSEALLALGVKRSEEPYTREDQDWLVGIATSLALLLEKPAVVPRLVTEVFEECPKCGICYDTGAARCLRDSESLNRMHLPRLLAGRYRLECRRGRGGMGAVYEAMDMALERRVAVKVIRDELIGSADAAERFRREARAAASFAHPNVVTVYDFGVVAGTRAFLVMELLEGLTLREELIREKRVEPQRTLAIMRGVCGAVEAAHRRPLAHRDLKPENIFLAQAEAGEIAKVLDFGVAKFLSPLMQATALMEAPTGAPATADTGPGMLVGTWPYMSPEQLQGEPVELSWDLWALAVVAYEMLTGALPFTSVSLAEWQSAVLAGRFVPLARYLPEAPARWQEFFTRAFAAQRSDRPSSARMFFSELERALS